MDIPDINIRILMEIAVLTGDNAIDTRGRDKIVGGYLFDLFRNPTVPGAPEANPGEL